MIPPTTTTTNLVTHKRRGALVRTATATTTTVKRATTKIVPPTNTTKESKGPVGRTEIIRRRSTTPPHSDPPSLHHTHRSERYRVHNNRWGTQHATTAGGARGVERRPALVTRWGLRGRVARATSGCSNCSAAAESTTCIRPISCSLFSLSHSLSLSLCSHRWCCV